MRKDGEAMTRTHFPGPNSGMTITEVVVALAVIALTSMLLLACFSSAMNMLGRSADRQSASDAAYAGVQSSSAAKSGGSVTLVLEGKSYAVSGSFVTAEQDGVVYRLFVPE